MSHSVHAAQAANLRGRHICLPYETDAEKESAVLSLVHEGLARGRRCLFVGTRAEYDRLGLELEERGICSPQAESRGALLFMTREAAYLENGSFDPNVVLGRIERFITEALADGFTGLCATGDLIENPSDDLWRQIVWYEAQVNEHFSRLPFVGLCRYPRTTVPPHRVQDVLRNHPIAIVRGESCDNPFYERPDLALSDDSEARVDWQLRQLRVVNRVQRQLEGKTASAVTAAVELATELETLRSTIRSTENQ
jgi:MEDS: MEthanogen/methylotroph, DcmR Sensory domain